jgi:hypothetical protein
MMMDTLHTLVGTNDLPESWIRHGKEALETPHAAILPGHDALIGTAEAFALPPRQIGQLVSMRNRILQQDGLYALFRLWHTIFFLEQDASAEAYSAWPMPMELDESEKAVFRAFVVLSGADGLGEALSSHGLTSHWQACVDEYVQCTGEFFSQHGVYGLANEKMWWLWPVFLGRVFRLGRLTFEIGFYEAPYGVFQHRTGQWKLLAGGQERYDESGHEAEAGLYHPSLVETQTHFIGYGFTDKGLFEPNRLRLCRSEWTRVVKPGEPVLSLHIPPEGKLDSSLVQDSLRQAVSFFSTHFPEHAFRLFMCHSWLLNTELETFLTPASNILAFQSLFSIALANPDEDALFSFLFRVPKCPLDQLVPKTGFQERVLAFVRGGGILWDGFGVFPVTLNETRP